jgi:uncharacterized delta-60 repeat protein
LLGGEACQPGQLDPRFSARVSHRGYIRALVAQPDGRFYAAGRFESINGILRASLARLWPDGAVDESFVPPPALIVNTVALHAEGTLFANLEFSGIPGRLARLRPDGSEDATFSAGAIMVTTMLATQPDGKVLVATWQGGPRLFRLRPDGSPDPSFSVTVNNSVNAAAVLPEGRLLIGGDFTTVNGMTRGGIARLNGDGSLDTAFNPVANPDAWVNGLAVLPDGRVLLAGGFGRRDGSPRRAIARLWPDGELDPTFDPGAGIGPGDVKINALAVQADGRVLIGGNFAQVNGVARGSLARLNVDGGLDSSFLDTQLSSDDDIEVRAILLQGPDRALIGGDDPIGLVRVCLGQTGVAPAIKTSPASQTCFAGQSVTLSAVATGTPPLCYQWRRNGVELAGATNAALTISDLTPADAGRYSVSVANAAGAAVSGEAVLTVLPRPHGADWVDPSFDPICGGRTVGPADGRASVCAIALQPEGRAVIAGNFSALNGVPRPGLARLNADRTLDAGFPVCRRIDRPIQALALQADGRVLIGGTFTSVDARPRSGLARLHADGALDVEFRADTGGPNVGFLGVGPDGKVWVGGNFVTVAGAVRRNLARLNPDGTVDAGFTPPAIVSGQYDYVSWVHTLGDGRLLVGGHFESRPAQGMPDQNLVRLHPDGSLDLSFTCDLSGLYLASALVRPDATIVAGGMLHSWTGTSHYFVLAELGADGQVVREYSPAVLPAMVTSVLLQTDGKLVIGGMFSTVYGVTRNGVARLHPDGTLDTGFDPGPTFGNPEDPSVLVLAQQADGRVWVGAEHAGQTEATQALALLEPDGQPVAGFKPRLLGTGGVVTALECEPGGGLLVGGDFSSFNGQPRNHLARLNPDGALAPDFTPDLSLQLGVRVLLRQPDGKVLVAGRVDAHAPGPPLSGIVRLNPDGSRDTTFDVSPDADGACGYVRCLALQPDGKILVGGEFDLPPRGLARLQPDGTTDRGFVPPALPAWDEEGVHAVAVLGDGRILIGGDFAGVPNGTHSVLVRLNPDGSMDGAYDLGVVLHGSVRGIVPAPNGEWLVAGVWAEAGDNYRAGLLRLNARGDLAGVIGIKEPIQTWPLAIAIDGHLLVGGATVLRLTPEGMLDRAFTVRLRGGGVVNALLVQPDGRLVIGGDFSSVNGLPVNNLARLYATVSTPAPFVERHLGPETQVKLVAQPPAGTRRYSVEDRPSRHPVAGISHGGRYDATTGTVTFGPFGDEQARELTYWVIIPPGAAGQIQFQGTATANGAATPVVGDTSLRLWPFPPPPLWVDLRWRPLSQGWVLQVWSWDEGTCEVQASVDLRQWETVATFGSPTGLFEFVDASLAGACRFYRARQR